MSAIYRIPQDTIDALGESIEKMESFINETSAPFNEYDDAIMLEILPGRFAKPVQSLLETLHTIQATSGSFGVDKAKAYDALLPDLERLREACADEWADQ